MMKWMTFVLSAALVIGLVGCGKDDKKEKKEETSTSKGEEGAELAVTAPTAAEVAVDKSTDLTFKVKRTKWEGDVEFTFDTKGTGLKIDDSDTKIPKGSD